MTASSKEPCKPPKDLEPTKHFGENILGKEVVCWGYTWVCTECSQNGYKHFLRVERE